MNEYKAIVPLADIWLGYVLPALIEDPEHLVATQARARLRLVSRTQRALDVAFVTPEEWRKAYLQFGRMVEVGNLLCSLAFVGWDKAQEIWPVPVLEISLKEGRLGVTLMSDDLDLFNWVDEGVKFTYARFEGAAQRATERNYTHFHLGWWIDKYGWQSIGARVFIHEYQHDDGHEESGFIDLPCDLAAFRRRIRRLLLRPNPEPYERPGCTLADLALVLGDALPPLPSLSWVYHDVVLVDYTVYHRMHPPYGWM